MKINLIKHLEYLYFSTVIYLFIIRIFKHKFFFMIDLIGFIAFGYFTVSSILFCFPLWRSNRIVNPLLKKVLRKKGILHISHRGGSRDNLENTIEAFQYA